MLNIEANASASAMASQLGVAPPAKLCESAATKTESAATTHPRVNRAQREFVMQPV